MYKNPNECRSCFAKKVCTIAALSLEKEVKREGSQGKFAYFTEMEDKLSA